MTKLSPFKVLTMDSTKTVYNCPISNLAKDYFKSVETSANMSASISAKDYPLTKVLKIGNAFLHAAIP